MQPVQWFKKCEFLKRYKFHEMLLKILATASETLIIYMGYIFIRHIMRLPDISLLYLVLNGTLSILVSAFRNNKIEVHIKRNWLIGLGATLSLVFSILITRGYRIESTVFIFIIMFFIWSRGVRNFYEEYETIYNITLFYIHIGIIVFLNISVLLLHIETISPEIMRYTVLYVVTGIFVLFEIKNNKYLKKSKQDKIPFDLIATLAILAVTFIVSTPKAIALAAQPFRLVIPVISKLMVYIIAPIAYGTDALKEFLMSRLMKNSKKVSEGLGGIKTPEFESYVYNNEMVALISRILSVFILVIVVMVLVYLIIQYISKVNKKGRQEDYTEDKEFILGSGVSKLPQYMNTLKNKVSDAISQVTFHLSADNGKKLHYEYKVFLAKLQSRKILEAENYTAQDVRQLISTKYPHLENLMQNITDVFENVRYGTHELQNEELKTFKKHIAEALKGTM